MAFNLFQTMGDEIKLLMNNSISAISSSWVSELISVLSICITVYIIFYGYLILAGKVQEPIKELIWNLARFAIVLSILQGYPYYLELITNIIDELKVFLTGAKDGKTIYTSMDDKFIKLSKVYVEIFKHISWNPITWVTGLFQIGIGLVLVFGTVFYCVSVLASELTMMALLAVFPLFLFCYLWNWFKDMFSMWVQAVIGVLIYCLFVSLFIDIGYKIADFSLAMDKSMGVYGVFGLFVAGAITLGGCRVSINLATSLSKVSINHNTGTVDSVQKFTTSTAKLLKKLKDKG